MLAMAEIGLVRFAEVALPICEASLKRHRTRFSKKQFTQPQLLTILCLMKYEDWTYREAEVRLSEHGELRKALRLKSVPNHTTLHRFLLRLEETAIERSMAEILRWVPLPKGRRRLRVAVDATGLSTGACSTFFVRRQQQHTQKPRAWSHWLKWLVAVDVDRQLLLVQRAHAGLTNDGTRLRGLLEQLPVECVPGLVLADAEFDSELNHRFIRRTLHAESVIPAKRGKATWRIHGVRAKMRSEFPKQKYCRRALVESVFSTAKRKLSARAQGRTFRTQCLQALLLGLSYNFYKL